MNSFVRKCYLVQMGPNANNTIHRQDVVAFFRKVVECCPKDDTVLKLFDGHCKNVSRTVKKLLIDIMMNHVSPTVVSGFLQDLRVMSIQSGDNELFWEAHRRIRKKKIECYSDFILINTAIHHNNNSLVEQYSCFMNREVTPKNMAFLIFDTSESVLRTVFAHTSFIMTKERVQCVKLVMSDIHQATLKQIDSKIAEETYKKTHDPTSQSRKVAASRLRDAMASKRSLIDLFITKLSCLHDVKCKDGPLLTNCYDGRTKPTTENIITCALALSRLLWSSEPYLILKDKNPEFIALLIKTDQELLAKSLAGYIKDELLSLAVHDKTYSVAKVWINVGADPNKVTPGFITDLDKTDKEFLKTLMTGLKGTTKDRLMVGALVENDYAIAKMWIQWGASPTNAIPHVWKLQQSRDMMEFIFKKGGTLDKCSLWEVYSSKIRDNYLVWDRLGLQTNLHGFAGMVLNAPLETILVMLYFDPHILNRVFDADNVKFEFGKKIKYLSCETTLLTYMLLSGKYEQVKSILQLLLQKQHTGWLIEHDVLAPVLKMWQPLQHAHYLQTHLVKHICGYLTTHHVHHVFDIDKETLCFKRDNHYIIDRVSFVWCAHEKGYPDLVAMTTCYAQNTWSFF